MRSLRFHRYGDPADVLQLDDAKPPQPGPGQVRVLVQACGLTPADWALCGGLFAGDLPRGIGLEVAGTVDALGDGVTGTALGDEVFGPAPFTGATAGASDVAVLDVWFPRPAELDVARAAALPMAVETAARSLGALRVEAGSTLLVHGAGTTVGLAAAQIAVLQGTRVIATAGDTYAGLLRDAGVEVTPYGDGMVERVLALAGGPVDLVLDTAPASGVLPDLVHTVTSPEDVMTVSDFAAAPALGVRTNLGAGTLRHDVVGDYAQLAARGRFSIPVAETYALEDWRTAMERSRSQRARGKLVLQVR